MSIYNRFLHFILLPIAFCFLAAPSVSAQSWKLFKKNDSLNCRYFATDPLNNIYVVTPKNDLLKYDQQGFFESQYANRRLGRLAVVDGTSPFKVVLWYPDFQTILLMDAAVNPIVTLNLNDIGVGRAAAVAFGDDGNLWIFDGTTNKLLRFAVEAPSVRLVESSLLSVNGLQPSGMTVRGNVVYMNVPTRGILTFDRFGKLLRTLDIRNAETFQVIDNQLFFKQNNQLSRFHLQTLTTTLVKLPDGVKGEQQMRLERNRLFVQRGGSIDIYEEK